MLCTQYKTTFASLSTFVSERGYFGRGLDKLSNTCYDGFVIENRTKRETPTLSNIAPRSRMSEIDYSHLGTLLAPELLAKKLRLAASALRSYEFDTIAFRGMSGALCAPTLAMRLKKQLILVRKPEDSTHDRQDVEGFKGAKRYIIVDDFVCTGNTKRAIIKAVKEFTPEASYVGLLSVKTIEKSELEKYQRDGRPYPLK